jgi:hypothetical protein
VREMKEYEAQLAKEEEKEKNAVEFQKNRKGNTVLLLFFF